MYDFTKICIVFFGGVLSHMFGGFDVLLQGLLWLMFFDMATGICKYFLKKSLSPDELARGVVKKIMVLIVVAMTNIIQNTLAIDLPLRETVIFFYCSKEFLSVILNINGIIPIPQEIMQYFKYFESKGGKDKDENSIN